MIGRRLTYCFADSLSPLEDLGEAPMRSGKSSAISMNSPAVILSTLHWS